MPEKLYVSREVITNEVYTRARTRRPFWVYECCVVVAESLNFNRVPARLAEAEEKTRVDAVSFNKVSTLMNKNDLALNHTHRKQGVSRSREAYRLHCP